MCLGLDEGGRGSEEAVVLEADMFPGHRRRQLDLVVVATRDRRFNVRWTRTKASSRVRSSTGRLIETTYGPAWRLSNTMDITSSRRSLRIQPRSFSATARGRV